MSRVKEVPRPRRHRGLRTDTRLPLKEVVYQETWLWSDGNGTLWVGQLGSGFVSRTFLGHIWYFSTPEESLDYFYLSQPEYLEFWAWKEEREGKRREPERYWEEDSEDGDVCV